MRQASTIERSPTKPPLKAEWHKKTSLNDTSKTERTNEEKLQHKWPLGTVKSTDNMSVTPDLTAPFNHGQTAPFSPDTVSSTHIYCSVYIGRRN